MAQITAVLAGALERCPQAEPIAVAGLQEVKRSKMRQSGEDLREAGVVDICQCPAVFVRGIGVNCEKAQAVQVSQKQQCFPAHMSAGEAHHVEIQLREQLEVGNGAK